LYQFILTKNKTIEMRIPIFIFTVLLCCVLCFSDENLALLTAPRVLLAYMLLFWLRCEWCIRKRVDEICSKAKAVASFRQECKLIKENFELSQTVMHLSEQHELLRDIRNTGLKTLHCSRDTYAEVRLHSAMNRASHLSTVRRAPDESPQQVVSMKAVDAKEVLKAKLLFRRGSFSENSLPLARD
jgi:hypothetical protein